MAAKKALSMDNLRTFLAVYRTGSFTGAAAQLGISQPTVTNHIRQVEAHYGQSVFVRGLDGVSATAHAHELARSVGDALDQLERFVAGDVQDKRPLGSVRIGAPREVLGTLLLPALAGETGNLPQIEAVFGESSTLLDDLVRLRIDLVLSTVRPRDASIMSWPIADEEFWVVAAPNLAVEGPRPEAFDGLPFVAYNSGLALIRRFWNTVYQREPRFETSLIVPDLQTVKAAVIAGFGISVLPDYLVEDEVRTGVLVRLDDLSEPPLNTVFLAACRPTLQARPYLAGFAELLIDRVKAHRGDQEASGAGSVR
ncbi:MAG: LysR family transcriptional regulator [Gordonia sp. (in: high G+C Gram-positive bacteria)]|uniref:LysR family transcriptional regulator n=1 Tax=Gordonia sp. (in: high G+C Gram-positive bacteria) TaxID=84139 RepID=UPI0039E2DB3A